jgi:hypothetical protein
MDDAVNEICAETDTMAAGAPLPDEISSRSTTTYWLLQQHKHLYLARGEAKGFGRRMQCLGSGGGIGRLSELQAATLGEQLDLAPQRRRPLPHNGLVGGPGSPVQPPASAGSTTAARSARATGT